MIATQTHNRLGAHFDAPPAPKRGLPKTERERGQLWSDVVLDAVLALHKQLESHNEAVVAAAANSILDLERTRLRHGKDLAGSTHKSDAEVDSDERCELDPLPDLGRKSATERKPRAEKPTLPPAPAEPLDDATLLRRHAEEALDVLAELNATLPERLRKPVTMETAEGYVRSVCGEYRLKLSDIPPGHFRRISKAMIDWDVATN